MIVPPYTFIATASAVVAVNAIPIFADIEPDTFNLDPQRAEEAITDRTTSPDLPRENWWGGPRRRWQSCRRRHPSRSTSCGSLSLPCSYRELVPASVPTFRGAVKRLGTPRKRSTYRNQ